MARDEKQSMSGPDLASLERAVSANPADTRAWLQLAVALRSAGRYRDAISAFDHAARLDPGSLAASRGAAEIYQAFARYEEAVGIYARLVAASPDLAAAQVLYGTALRSIGELAEAERSLRRALDLDPASADAWHGLATIQGDRGQLEQAALSYQHALELRPDFIEALTNLVLISDIQADSPELARLESWIEQGADQPQLRLQAHFALGKAYEELQDYARAFAHLRKGNEIKRGTIRFDRQAQREFTRRVINVFDAATIERMSVGASDDITPIFVMGMPRSGTTLVEQILASHPRVHGAGEVRFLANAIHSILGAHDDWSLPDRFAACGEDGLKTIAGNYLDALRQGAPEASRITDKMLGNISLVGAILALFPRASIVFVWRNPIDTCVSCYSKHFHQGHEFSYDFDDLAAYLALYQQLMEHWNATQPHGRIFNVKYEELVSDLAGTTAQLLAYCNLEWDDACLNFHQTSRDVATASRAQVRKPVYATSVERWRRYEAYLRPLLDALDREKLI